MKALHERVFGPLWQGGAPFIVWALHFFAVYVLVASGCTAGWQDVALLGTSLLRVVLVLVCAVALAGIAWLLWRADGGRPPRGQRGLLAVAAAGSAWLSLVGVAWVSVPVLMLPLCAPA